MWTQDELKFFSDLIATGVVVSTKDLNETNTFVGWEEIKFRGVETTFLITGTSKGAAPTNRLIVLHHYRFASSNTATINGPGLVSFRSGDTNVYLLYLKKDANGTYEPLSSQIDPWISVRRQL